MHFVLINKCTVYLSIFMRPFKFHVAIIYYLCVGILFSIALDFLLYVQYNKYNLEFNYFYIIKEISLTQYRYVSQSIYQLKVDVNQMRMLK